MKKHPLIGLIETEKRITSAINKLTAMREELRANSEPETETQNEMIRTHLESGQSITPLDALHKFGCFRLGARIHNLRSQGMDIETEIVRQGNKRFAKYSLKCKPNAE